MDASNRRVAALLLVSALVLLAAWWLLRPEAPVLEVPAAAVPVPAPEVEAEPSTLQALIAKRFPGIDVLALERASKKCEADAMQATRRRWEALGRSDRRDDRIAHALMAGTFDDAPGESTRLLGALLVATPDDADLLWLHAARCDARNGCDPRAAMERLIAAEPDNLASWFLLLGHLAGDAGTEMDPAQFDALLAGAARASQYTPRHVDVFLRVHEAVRDVPVPPSCNAPGVLAARRIIAQMGVSGAAQAMHETEMAFATAMVSLVSYMPNGGGMGRLCAGDALSPSRQQSCRAILARMADGETLLDQGMGTGLMAGLADGMPATEAAQWRERYRQHRWLMEQQSQLGFDVGVETAFERIVEGEVRSTQRALERKGLWPPPAGWLPDDPRGRTLVTGRPPDA